VTRVEITYSEEISQLLTQLARRKRLKFARPLALYATPSNTAEARALLRIVCEKYPGAPNFVTGIAKTSDTTFFFDKPEEVVLEELRNLKVPRKGKTAPKVLVKMIYTRLVKLKDACDILLECQRDDQRGFFTKYAVPPIVFDELTSVPLAFQKTTPNIRQLKEDVVGVTTRDDVTPEILVQAWDLYQTHLIMST
jgi:hypothetical protein